MRCDDLVFQIDTITNQVRYRTRATWWRSRPAHNPQRSSGAGPPCHPRTPPKAAQPKAQSPQPVKKGVWGWLNYLQLCLLHAARAGKGVTALREMCGSSVRLMKGTWIRKARSLSTRLGPARQLGTRRGDIRSLIEANRRSRSLIQANRRSDTSRSTSSIRQARLRTTPFSHAFRPRLSHAFQPRLSATPSGHVFRRAIRIEDVEFLSQQCFKQTNR